MPNEYIDGNSYHDDPNGEHSSPLSKGKSVVLDEAGNCAFPCYVYDKHGTLLRIEYPKYKEPEKWTSRYSSY